MEKIRKPVYRILYEEKDVTRDLEFFIISVKYKDNINGIMDEVWVELDNRDGRWFDSWYPMKYNRINLYIGYEGQELLYCGRFIIDEKNYRGKPDVLTLKCSSIPWESPQIYKTKRNRVFENSSLKKVVSEVITGAGLQPLIRLKEDISIKRIEQQNIPDSKFLFELGKKFGAFVKFMEEKVVFSSWDNLMQASSAFSINRKDVISYKVNDNIHNLYEKAVVEYFDKEENKLKTFSFKDPYVKHGDVLKIQEKAEDLKQAEEMAKAALRANNLLQTKLEITMMGDTKYVAGLTLDLSGFGNYNGKYFINSVSHEISNSGYKSVLELMQCWSY